MLRTEKTRGFHKLSTEAWPGWCFQYMEVQVANALRFIIDCQIYYLKKGRTTFGNNLLDTNKNFICSIKILFIMFAWNTKPQSKHSDCRRWRSIFIRNFKNTLNRTMFMYFQGGLYTEIWIDIICGYI